jgi:hypothetical protein
MVEPSFNRSNRSGESVKQAPAGRALNSQSFELTLEAKFDIGDFEG